MCKRSFTVGGESLAQINRSGSVIVSTEEVQFIKIKRVAGNP